MSETGKTLKPCPHCGEREQLYPSYRMDKDGKCHGPYAVDCLGCGSDFTPREGTNVIEAWNRRAPEQGLREALFAITSVVGNVDHRGGGANAARMYADMLKTIREVALTALGGGKP